MLPLAPPWAVPVRKSLAQMLICGVGLRTSWLLARGALVSPLADSSIRSRCKIWNAALSDVIWHLRHPIRLQLYTRLEPDTHANCSSRTLGSTGRRQSVN
jgi:hypothetical protein